MNQPTGIESNPKTIQHTFLIIGLFWSLIIFGLFAWGVHLATKRTGEILLSQARPFFEQIITTRSWNARHGGVYVPITKDDQPNPYLQVPNRDIETTNGMKLTLINPAYMTRQIAELAQAKDQIIYHLTSDRPLRPANAAAPWELAAIKSFKSTKDEYFDMWQDESGRPVFRYMAPVWTEKACIQCHGQYGYGEGDLRGGLSVILPAGAVINEEHKSIASQGIAYSVIWILGLTGLAIGSREITKRDRKRQFLIERLEHTLQGLLPICSSCKNIRNEHGEWERMEYYISNHSEAQFSHSLCPNCAKRIYGNFYTTEMKD